VTSLQLWSAAASGCRRGQTHTIRPTRSPRRGSAHSPSAANRIRSRWASVSHGRSSRAARTTSRFPRTACALAVFAWWGVPSGAGPRDAVHLPRSRAAARRLLLRRRWV